MTHAGVSAPSTAPALLLGLTGGIGSGKSAAANLFTELGVPVVDVDLIAHELTAPEGAAMPAIRAAFGDGMLSATGALDRAAMRRLVFSDPDAKTRLEAILHPQIHAESQRRCTAALAGGAPYTVLVVPLLIESGFDRHVDRILVVDCPEDLQLSRLMTRDGESAAGAQQLLAAQVSRKERLARADDVVDNSGSLAATRQRVTELDARYRALASHPAD